MAYWLGGTPKVDVAIVTVIPPELFAARDALGLAEDARAKDEAGTVSYRGKVRSALARRHYEVVLTCIGRAGNVLTAAAVQDVIARYRPQVVLLVGIAAGIRGKVRIGEVVLSERVVSYEPAAAVRTPEGGSRLEPRPEIRTLPHRMQQDVVHYQPSEPRLLARFEEKGGTFPQPPPGKDALYQEHVAARLTVKAATVASGEKLLRDPGKLLEVRTLHGKTEVGEMEAAGLMEACERSGIPWLAIRGISDFGDELKDDRFHELASRAVAAVMADFIEHGLELKRRGRRGALAVAWIALLMAVVGTGVHAWATQRQAGRPQPTAPAASKQPKDTPAQERQEKPTSSGEARQSEAMAPQPQPATHSPETKPAAEHAPTMKTKVGNVQAGDGARLKAGNIQGPGSADTQVGDVKCGDNCVIEVGNKTE
jgi:nucleoside phosphorylase